MVIPGFVKLIVVAFAGAGATDFLTALLRGRPVQEVARTFDWTRLLINVAVVTALFFVARFLKQKFDN